MAYLQDRSVTLGELLGGTFQTLFAIRRELAIYFGAFLVAGLIHEFVTAMRPIIPIASFAGYFAGQYWLYRRALAHNGCTFDNRFKGFSFFAMAAILAVPIYFGFAFFIIPGLLLAAKWIMAPAMLVSERIGVLEANGTSWRASGSNLAPLAGALAILCLIWIALFTAISGLGTALETALDSAALDVGSLRPDGAGGLGIHLLPVLLLGLSVTAYRSLADEENDLVAVFE